MPSCVDVTKCDGCKGKDKTACQYICPNDLMKLDMGMMKAWNQEPEGCWECYSCVKICPQGAIVFVVPAVAEFFRMLRFLLFFPF